MELKRKIIVIFIVVLFINSIFLSTASASSENVISNVLTTTFTVKKSTSGGSPGGGGGGGFVVPPKTPPLENVKTNDDKALNGSIEEIGEAVISVAGRLTSAARFSQGTIVEMAEENRSLRVENDGIQVQFTPLALTTEKFLKIVEEDEDVTLEIGVREVIGSEKEELLAKASLGQGAGLFEIGGKIFDLWARILTSPSQEPIEISNFNEPVKITIDLSYLNLTEEDSAKLTAIRYQMDEQGNIMPVKLGGAYDPLTKIFNFYTDKFSYYGILKAQELVKIHLEIGKLNTTVNEVLKAIDVPPVIMNNRTMVPVRFVSEQMGADVNWVEETRAVVIKQHGKELRMIIGQTGPGLDVPPIIVNSRTLVPLRYVSENLGANVIWFPSTRSVEIVK